MDEEMEGGRKTHTDGELEGGKMTHRETDTDFFPSIHLLPK